MKDTFLNIDVIKDNSIPVEKMGKKVLFIQDNDTKELNEREVKIGNVEIKNVSYKLSVETMEVRDDGTFRNIVAVYSGEDEPYVESEEGSGGNWGGYHSGDLAMKFIVIEYDDSDADTTLDYVYIPLPVAWGNGDVLHDIEVYSLWEGRYDYYCNTTNVKLEKVYGGDNSQKSEVLINGTPVAVKSDIPESVDLSNYYTKDGCNNKFATKLVVSKLSVEMQERINALWDYIRNSGITCDEYGYEECYDDDAFNAGCIVDENDNGSEDFIDCPNYSQDPDCPVYIPEEEGEDCSDPDSYETICESY